MSPKTLTFIVPLIACVLLAYILLLVDSAEKREESKTCQEYAWDAQAICQVRTEQPCVEVFEQHLRACREEKEASGS